MHDEFLSLTKNLKVPLLAAADIAALHRLQKQWEHWANREAQHDPSRIAEEQQSAYDAFLDNPNGETEQRMLITADEALTTKRYALMRRACAELRKRISAEAAAIISPAVDRALAALRSEHEHRLAKAEPVMSSKHRNPRVIEAKRAAETAEAISTRLFWATSGTVIKPPLELAGVLIGETNKLTLEAVQ
jgi:hypothetical protein